MKVKKDSKVHKAKPTKEKGASEGLEHLAPQKKRLSLTRTKRPRTKLPDAERSTGPNLEDFRDLIEDEDDVEMAQAKEDHTLGRGSVRRSTSQGRTSSSYPTSSWDRPQRSTSRRNTKTEEPKPPILNTTAPEPEVIQQGIEKPLPRLLAPRPSVSSLMTARKATVQAPGPSLTTATSNAEAAGLLAKETAASSTVNLQEGEHSEETRKKRHSALGHLWKSVKADLFNPKAAAADLQALSLSAASLSVSAAKSASSAMSSMAVKVESDFSDLHDQILGGKRNLPDHNPASRVLKGIPSSAKPSTQAISITVNAVSGNPPAYAQDTSTSSSKALQSASGQGLAELSLDSKAATEPINLTNNPRKSTSAQKKPVLTNTDSSDTDGLTVMKSKGSAYMLSKYEEEPESPSVLTEALTKSVEMLSHSTDAVLDSASGGARYLKRVMLCGIGGRHKG